MSGCNEIGAEAHRIANVKGWYQPGQQRSIPELIALIHSEASEALECFRENQMSMTLAENGKPEGMPSELADIIIRVADMAHYLQIDLDLAVAIKMKFNETRPYRHGNKKA